MEPFDPGCDGSGPHGPKHEPTRVLPSGGDSNLILCRHCFNHEIAYRRDRNRDLGDFAKFDLPEWQSLRVYRSDA